MNIRSKDTKPKRADFHIAMACEIFGIKELARISGIDKRLIQKYKNTKKDVYLEMEFKVLGIAIDS